MNHEGYGVTIKGKPHGIWPIPLSRARRTAKSAIDRGYDDVGIVPVHSGERVPLVEPVPIFKEKELA